MDLTNAYYIFLFFGISQGLFLSIAIPSTKNANNPANKVLALIILLATLMLTGRILYFSNNGEWVIRLAGLVDTTIFLFGPLIYLYTLKFSETRIRFSKLHYIPAILHTIYVGVTFCFSLAQLNQFYFDGSLRLLLLGIESSGIISLSIYLLLSFSQLRKFSSSSLFGSKNLLSTKKYLACFLSIFSILAIVWIVSFSLNVSGTNLSFIGYDVFWIITPIVFYLVGYFSLSSPEILRDFLKRPTPDRLSFEETKELKAKLKVLVEEQQIYLRSDLTLKKLAEELDTSENNLSWYFNQVLQKSFYDFINQIRIDAFQAKIEKKEHQKHTLLALAMGVGFSSKSTFNRAYKSLLGNTPSDYVKNRTELTK